MNTRGRTFILRCLVLMGGLFVMALGVGFSVRGSLGTAPVSSLPYVLSLYFPVSLGTCTTLVNSSLILVQIALLRHRYQPLQLLQLVVALCFGFFVDLAALLIPWVQPHSYPMQWVCVLVGCVLIGIGVSMQVQAGVVTMPAEGLVRAITLCTGGEFGKTKVLVDVGMVTLATTASLLLFGRLNGVREGTVAAALSIGWVVRAVNRRFVIFKKPTGQEESA